MNLEEYKNYLSLNIDAKNTQKNYLRVATQFFANFPTFNQQNFDNFLLKKLEEGVSKNTFNLYMFALKKYSEFSGIGITCPKQKKSGRTERAYLTEQELFEELFPYFQRLFKNYEFVMFVFKLFFYTGLRPCELVNLKTEDIFLKDCYFIIRDPKDKDDRKIPFPKELLLNVELYKQKEGSAFKITYLQLKYYFDKINNYLNYKKKLTPYSLRNSFAYYCIEQGMPLDRLQLLMGHADIQTTMIYAKPNEKQAIDCYYDTVKIYKPKKGKK